MKANNIRNVAIIAHVDHGKTTLLDKLLAQSGMLDGKKQGEDRIMDSNPLERERGITILSKNTSMNYGGKKINIIDTPGHADFGGEVERILNMVDAVLLLVDAREGPMPQTRFVLGKALEQNLKPLVVINKIDRPDQRAEEVHDMILDLFIDLGASEEQLDFPYLYASAKNGYASEDLEARSGDMRPLLDMIVEKLPAPEVDHDGPLQILVADTPYDHFLGRLLLGRIYRGNISLGERLVRINTQGKKSEEKVLKLFTFDGLQRMETETLYAGDIALIAGIQDGNIGESLCHLEHPDPLPVLKVDDPTVAVSFKVNDSPFAGKEGDFVTSRQLRDRLYKEALTNVALKVEDTDRQEEFKVSGRGELHLGILMENMRREGYEFAVSRPEIVMKIIDGKKHEPYEEFTAEVPDASVGGVMEELGRRKADVQEIKPAGEGRQRIIAHVPTRAIIGFRSQFLSMTKGEGIFGHILLDYRPYSGETLRRPNGSLIASESGDSVAYALWKLEDRGEFFINAGVPVYEGMILGANTRREDLTINVCMTKKLTNVRAAGSDENILLTPPRKLSLEDCLEFLDDDELLEITPKSYRLRKRFLKEFERKRQRK